MSKHFSLGRGTDPVLWFGFYRPHGAVRRVGAKVERGHFSAGIRDVVGFYVELPRVREAVRAAELEERRRGHEDVVARVLRDAG